VCCLRGQVSQYLEARYALQVIERARVSTKAVARDLILDLVKDLFPPIIPTETKGKRDNALQAIRALALCFGRDDWPPPAYWDDAKYAAEAWCKEAVL
jgi:hypothetical protein